MACTGTRACTALWRPSRTARRARRAYCRPLAGGSSLRHWTPLLPPWTTIRHLRTRSWSASLSEFFFDTVFTRAIVSPDSEADGSAHLHARDGAVLSRLLLTHLAHHGLNLVKASARTGDRHTDVGRPSVPGSKSGEESEALSELVERVLAVCEQHYEAVTGTSPEQWDQETSREIVDIALRTVHLADREAYPQALEEYLVANRARLEQLWRVYGPAGVFPPGVYHLVELPGSFMLCERLKAAPMWLEGIWARE